jgi:hypothetical protein
VFGDLPQAQILFEDWPIVSTLPRSTAMSGLTRAAWTMKPHVRHDECPIATEWGNSDRACQLEQKLPADLKPIKLLCESNEGTVSLAAA